MSSRRLGKGRVLGTAKPAVPVPSPSPSLPIIPQPPASSDSSLSLSQPSTTSPIPSPSSTANASSRILCPICNEQMVTLLQLNRHLDDAHQNLEEVQQEDVKNWFQSQVDKAKKLPALDFLEKKFRALDVFESNDTPIPVVANTQNGHISHSSVHSIQDTAVSQPKPPPKDTEEQVTRKHWQKQRYNDVCLDPLCGRPISGSAAVNCRCCGKLFCEEHSMYQMKLSKAASHDPVRGVWCRVCETCYKSRIGYNDTKGYERDHTTTFMKLRSRTVDKLQLETNRLEKRLTSLTQLLTNPPPADSTSSLWSLTTSTRSQLRSLEQSIIPWEDDAKAPKCPFCQQEFSNYSFRRHHCRLCGRVVCGDISTLCSELIPLNVAAEKTKGPVGIDVRMCKDCKHTLFSKSDFEREVATKPPDQRSYDNLVQFERGIRLLLPKFQKLLLLLQDADNPPSAAQITQASKVRKRLTDSFIQYETTARRIRDLTTSSATQLRLQKAIYTQSSSFLHLNMLPLRSLPQILKHASPSPSPSNSRPSHPSRPSGAILARIGSDAVRSRSESSAALESLEAEEKEVRDKLMVLEEQQFMVGEMLASARKGRRLEEMGVLSANLDDLTREIDLLRGRVVRVESGFVGLYQEGD